MDDTERACDIRCLGVLEVICADSRVPGISGHVGKLLALLAVNANTYVPFERISETLWEDPPESSRQQIYNAVAKLRRRLAGHCTIHSDQSGYRLEIERASVDVLRFQDLVAQAGRLEEDGDFAAAALLLDDALRQWRGSAFTGITSTVLTNIAVALDEQRLSVAERTGDLHFGLAGTAAPIAELVHLVRVYPYREPLRAVVMKLLHLNGRTADAISIFEEGRQTLGSDLGVGVGASLRAAHEYVLTQSPDLPSGSDAGLKHPVEKRPEINGGRLESCGYADQNAANSLPRDIPEFTGQEDELKQLLSHARSDASTVVISAVNGMGGVGKTTLAVHVAHAVAGDYPDGQFFVDLRGFSASDDPLTPDEALYLLLRDSGVQPELIPSDLPGRTALWRKRVAGARNILVLLDNAAESAQIRPLLPGCAGPLVIISSRRRLPALEGALSVPLDAMSDSDALLLLSRIAGPSRIDAEPEAAREAVRLCGRLPLAIQIAAARLRDRPGWSVARLVERLGDHRERMRLLRSGDREVLSIVTWSYRYLSPRQQTVFRLLSLHPESHFDEDTVAPLSGLSRAEAADCLEELFDINLLQQSSSGRYYLHDLVLDGARHLSDEPANTRERAEAVLRLADSYLALSTALHATLSTHPRYFEPSYSSEVQPGPVTVRPTSEAMELLRGMHRGLTTMIKLCGSLGLNRHAWQLACTLLPYFMRVSFGADADAALEVALDSARKDGSSIGQSICRMGQSYSRQFAGDSAGALDAMIAALEFSRSPESSRLRLRQRIGLGVMYLDGNEFGAAEECFTDALLIAEELGSPREKASIINNLGVVTRELGRFDEALEYFRHTLELNAGLERPDLQSIAMSNIGQIHYLRQRYSEAATSFVQALELSRVVGSADAEIVALIGMCSTRRLLGDVPSAVSHGRQALELARKTGRRDLEGDSLNALGDVYLGMGNLAAATKVFENALAFAEQTRSPRYVARAREGLAHVAAASDDASAARSQWTNALSVNPGGVVDPRQARLHIEALDQGTPHGCWRCISR